MVRERRSLWASTMVAERQSQRIKTIVFFRLLRVRAVVRTYSSFKNFLSSRAAWRLLKIAVIGTYSRQKRNERRSLKLNSFSFWCACFFKDRIAGPSCIP